METGKATIKENDNDKLVTPSYMLANMFDHIKDEMRPHCHQVYKWSNEEQRFYPNVEHL